MYLSKHTRQAFYNLGKVLLKLERLLQQRKKNKIRKDKTLQKTMEVKTLLILTALLL